MTKLSVNVNKIATLRNSRGGNVPNLLKVAQDIQNFGGEGITIHPRPDQRHIRYQDAHDLKSIVHTEYNIEGNPIPKFIDLVLQVKPTQVTLVPDSIDAITSNAGWDTKTNKDFLVDVIAEFKRNDIRTSIFVDPEIAMIEGAAEVGTDRIELYTEEFASEYDKGNENAVVAYSTCAQLAMDLNLGVNAGHDLSLDNIKFFKENIPGLLEVSIGHALISLVILHGFLGMGDNWKTLGKKIAAQGFQVHLVDQRNHGRSFHSDDFDYQLLAQDLQVYCQENHLQKIILLGHSMGGKTAMLFAVNYPEMIANLIVADIGPKYYPLHHQDILDGLGALDFEELKSRAAVDAALGKYVPDMGVRMFLLKNLYWKEKGVDFLKELLNFVKI